MNLLLAWRLFVASVLPAGGDPFPYFKPDVVVYGCEAPHWKATECGAADHHCQDAHDQRVQDMAIMAGDVQLCRSAIYPGTCVDVVRLVLGEL